MEIITIETVRAADYDQAKILVEKLYEEMNTSKNGNLSKDEWKVLSHQFFTVDWREQNKDYVGDDYCDLLWANIPEENGKKTSCMLWNILGKISGK